MCIPSGKVLSSNGERVTARDGLFWTIRISCTFSQLNLQKYTILYQCICFLEANQHSSVIYSCQGQGQGQVNSPVSYLVHLVWDPWECNTTTDEERGQFDERQQERVRICNIDIGNFVICNTNQTISHNKAALCIWLTPQENLCLIITGTRLLYTGTRFCKEK